MNGVDAFKFWTVEYGWAAPPIDPDEMNRASRCMASMPPATGAEIVLAAQRKSPEVIVGAYGQLTTISKTGINTVLVCKWPDKIGELIDRRNPAFGRRGHG